MRWSGSDTPTALNISSSGIILTARDVAAWRCSSWYATCQSERLPKPPDGDPEGITRSEQSYIGRA